MTSIPRALASAISATLVDAAVDGDDQRRRRRDAAASTAASDSPWPSSSRLGHVRLDRRRRSAGSARVMIASPVSPSASKSPKTRTRSPRSRAAATPLEQHDAASGQGRGSCRPARAGRRTRRSRSSAGDRARGGEQAGQRGLDDARGRRRPATAGGRRHVRLGERPAEAGFDHRRQDATRLHRGSTWPARRGPQDAVRRTRGLAGRRQAAVPAVVPEVPVDEQRASPRRSTSRSPR